jgi:AsmA protein
LENFSLSGDVSGTPSTLTFNSGSIALDKLSGAGDFQLSLASNIPSLTGTLSLSPLDIRPYMAAWSAQKPQGKILPWSEEPIVLTGLSALDAKIDVKTPSIQLDRIEIGPTNGIISLEDGTLTADLTDAQLYDGTASGKFSIISDNGTPAIAVDAKIDSVAAQSFFMASAGFDKVTGKSDLTLSLNGKGDSQADIMRSLTGDGIFDILKGQLLGLDAGMLLSGVDTALTQRQLPEGIGLGKTTDFNDINGKFAIRNGKASLSGFQLKSGNFFIEADGSIDLGDQVIDIGLRPKLSTGSDLAQFGIPLRLTGGFGLAKPSLDTQFLGEIAKAKARAEAGNTVRENIGGSLGNLLGGVIGGQAPETQPPNETETTEETPPTTNPEASNVADPSKETEAKPEAEPADPAETPEEQIGNALKDLFGRKKKD